MVSWFHPDSLMEQAEVKRVQDVVREAILTAETFFSTASKEPAVQSPSHRLC